MSRSILVTRTELSLADLQLWNPPTLIAPEDGFGPGGVVRRRHTTQSPFIPKRRLISSVPEIQQGLIQVQCRSTSGSALKTIVASVTDAFSQTVYTVTFDYDGYGDVWSCEPADYDIGKAGVFDEFDLSFHEQLVTLRIFH